MRKTIVTIVAVIILLALAGLLANRMINSKKAPEARPAEETRIYVNATEVVYSTNETRISATGRLASLNDVDLSVEVQGQILPGNVLLKEGTRFRKGDLLIKIFEDEARNNLRASKSRFMNAIAGILPDIKIDYNAEFDKWSDFFNEIDINETLPALPAFNSDKEKIFLASRNILNDYYSIESAEIRLGKYRIYAPFAGTFTDVFMEVGSVASPGSRIATMIRTDSYELEVPVETDNIYWIEIGDRVNVSTEEGTHQWQGKVIRKADFVDPATQSITVFVQVNPDKKYPLYQGQYLEATFQSKVVAESMEIPRNALFNRNHVYTIEEGRLKDHQVNIIKQNEKTVLINGLNTGIFVVTEPLVNVREGVKAEIL